MNRENRIMKPEQTNSLSETKISPDHSAAMEKSSGIDTGFGFIDEKRLLARLPISRRTLGNWKARGIIPYIKIGRRCLYDWASVHGALLRRQRGRQC
jgi:hypothetical protein